MMDITPEVIDESLVGCKGTMHIKDFFVDTWKIILIIVGGVWLLVFKSCFCVQV